MNRYWAQREVVSSRSLTALDLNSWFDYWHTHPDWKGKGDGSPELRLQELALIYKILLKAESLVGQSGRPIQCWAIICESSLDDAVYLHSENPNGSRYPHTFECTKWDWTENVPLNEITDQTTHVIGRVQSDTGDYYVVRSRE